MKALFRLLGIVMVLAAFVACTQNDDGPLNISSSKEEFSGSGYFRKATLDSSAKIHLVDDTLFLRLDSVWAFSNCAKLMVKIDWTISGTVAELRPHLSYKHDSSKDCASPYIRPDTTIKLLFSKANLESVSKFDNGSCR